MRFLKNIYINGLKFLSDDLYIKLEYKIKTKKSIDLVNPVSFNEKINWLKINNRTNLITKCADKYKVRDYVTKEVGEDILIPLLWVGTEPKEIPFKKLPKSFVIKTNHASATNIIVKDKALINEDRIIKKLTKFLKIDYWFSGRQWAYKNIERKIIIEEYIGDINAVPKDYKFFVFNGKAKFVQIDYDRYTKHKRDFYNMDWEKMSMQCSYPNSNYTEKKTLVLEKAIEYAERLGKNFPFSRVDLYIIEDKIYFGEITFYPDGGYAKFYPENLDIKFGGYLDI
jgi:hypothetical protein